MICEGCRRRHRPLARAPLALTKRERQALARSTSATAVDHDGRYLGVVVLQAFTANA